MKSRVNSLFNSVTYNIGPIIVDPGDVQDWNCAEHVLLTHAHFDHIYGLNALWEMNSEVKVYTNQSGYRALLDSRLNLSKYNGETFVFNHPENIVIVQDNENVKLAEGFTAQAIFTPGHNDSCITWIVGNLLFTGDAYIPGIKVVSNLPGGDKAKSAESLSRIIRLAEGREICAGHRI